MKRKIFWGVILATTITLFLSAVLLTGVFYENVVTEMREELVTEADYISKALVSADDNYLNEVGLVSRNRITLIDFEGTVLFDNFADIATMENHLDRPEVQAALANGTGDAVRLSDTIGERTYYYAIRLIDGKVLRLAATTKTAFGIFAHSLIWIILTLAIVLAIVFAIAAQVTKSIVKPILKLDLDNPLGNDTYGELSPLLIRMARQNKKIDEQMKELSDKQNEFEEIMENMNEGLVIFGDKKNVLYANRTARKLFNNLAPEGISYLKLCRDIEYIKTLEGSFNGVSAFSKITLLGRIYRILTNPVVRSNHANAAVMFLIDITEKEQSEKMRQEFSANVSHELKTPLTSIMGYAEIIQNGIAKQEDIPRFSGEIFSEASHLLNMIEDIIKLSRLDEGDLKKEFTPIDLYKVSQSVIDHLQNVAIKKNVTVTLEGEHHVINGFEKTIYEMIFNLCDNAIIYNKEGGSVTVSITDQNKRVALRVGDTGVGIAAEHQSRVFERFYRVDSSHSKETGGTGLGLSIVKHTALLHEAEILMDSKVNVGTT
ncbi:MAG TPA: PAS domain-containing sensor histidine kinase, partial [Acholeplasmatales bacterium]|nr:PAS domain-containing sensor histidine kinase [Acholeplasmatales bacterium]